MKIYDLSCTLEKNMWFYGSPYIPFDMKEIATCGKNGYIARQLSLSSHMGTHIECEAHWKEDGASVTDIELAQLCGHAKVLRFEDGCQSFYEIDESRLKTAGAGALNKGDICILNTNWHRQTDQQKYVFESPFITVSGAEYLCRLGVKAVAFDFPMCGDPRDGMDVAPEGTQLPDVIFYDHGIPTVVGLVHVDQAPGEMFFTAAPLKIRGADGSPVRAMGIEF